MSGYPTLDEVKAVLGITVTTDDVFLEHKLAVAIDFIEGYCNRVFPLGLYIEKFAHARCGNSDDGFLFLKAPPIKVVHGVSATGWQQTGFGAICIPNYFNNSFTLQGQTIVVEYEGGFDPIPASILDILYQMVAAAYALKDVAPGSTGVVKAETIFGVAKIEYFNDAGGDASSGGGDATRPEYYADALERYRLNFAI